MTVEAQVNRMDPFRIALANLRFPATSEDSVGLAEHAIDEAAARGAQILCFPEAAENDCWFATVNYAGGGSPTRSAVVRPDGTLLTWEPYGEEGLLVADLDLGAATRLLAERCKSG